MTMTTREFSNLARELHQFAYWKSRRDQLVREALANNMPMIRIADLMGISIATVRRIKKETS